METLEKKINPTKTQRFKMKWLLIFGVLGPGIIAGTADNDAGGIATYAVAGASFGYSMLWILFLITFILALTQEMGARLGLVTGKGLAALIRENFSLKTTTFVVGITFLANWTNILAEYAGISSVADIYGVPRYIAILVCAVVTWYVIYKGSFKAVQKVFLTSSVLFFAYLIAGLMAHPDWRAVFLGTAVPQIQWTSSYFYTAVALIGTTITAWGQFFIQSYFVDKGVAAEHMNLSRWDVFIGSFWTDFIAFFIVIATGATLFKAGIVISDAGQAAVALEPFAGVFAKQLFAWGLLNASMLGLAVISMTTSYIVTEAFGWEGRVDLKKESPGFYKIFTFCVFSTALAMLIPGLPLVTILVGSQMLNTFVLPVLFVAILILLNRESLMGKYKNTLWLNIVSWISIVFIVGMAGTLLVMTLLNFGQ